MGPAALFYNATGYQNTATGYAALRSNTTGWENTANGYQALYSNTGGVQNTATGWRALYSNTTSYNTAYGYAALYSNTTGFSNAAVGGNALLRNTTGRANTATGGAALYENTTGIANTANGFAALYSNTTGNYNTATGFAALYENTTGNRNTANGYWSLFNNTTGNYNTATGFAALYGNTTGVRNVALGYFAGDDVTTAHDVIAIGTNGDNVSNSCYIGEIWQRPGGSQAVYVNAGGKLGQMVSSRRFKDEVKPMEKASEVIYGLEPVSFRYKAEIEPSRPLGFGLVAEEVEKINPDLVTRDKEGKPLSVRYDQVNAMLLNEFLKEHRKNETQETTIAELKAEIATLSATVKAQAEQIQKVSAQLELSKPKPQMVLNDQ